MPTCTAPDPCRPVREYGCTICQRYHDEFDALFGPHLMAQSKHGIRDRGPTPNEVLERIAQTPEGA